MLVWNRNISCFHIFGVIFGVYLRDFCQGLRSIMLRPTSMFLLAQILFETKKHRLKGGKKRMIDTNSPSYMVFFFKGRFSAPLIYFISPPLPRRVFSISKQLDDCQISLIPKCSWKDLPSWELTYPTLGKGKSY